MFISYKNYFRILFIALILFNLKQIHAYDIQKNVWKHLTTNKGRRDNSVCTTISTSSSTSNVVLICGGEYRSDCQVYDPMTDEWKGIEGRIPRDLWHSTMITAPIQSKYAAFILGGFSFNKQYSNQIYGVTKDLSSVKMLGNFKKARAYHVALRTNNMC